MKTPLFTNRGWSEEANLICSEMQDALTTIYKKYADQYSMYELEYIAHRSVGDSASLYRIDQCFEKNRQEFVVQQQLPLKG